MQTSLMMRIKTFKDARTLLENLAVELYEMEPTSAN